MRSPEPSQTAERVALTRAIEALLPENRRICWDPHAKFFLKDRLARVYRVWFLRKLFCMLSERHFPGVMASVLLRTRFIDEFLVEAVSSGARQVVNLGAGYDTRPLRFQSILKEVPVFELDHPATQQRKAAILKSLADTFPANLHLVPIVFERDKLKDRLISAGYRAGLRTAFIWEGVTYYIAPAAVEQTLKFVSGFSGSGGSIVLDFFPPSVTDGTSIVREARSMRARFRKFGEAFRFGMSPDEMPGFLSGRGFREISVFPIHELKDRYVRQRGRRRRVSEVFYLAQAGV
jgi:methyltransferase (TIGR00027 family)